MRGNCSVRARVPGLSETINLRSIVGRFLEHSRIYRFGPPGPNAIYYIGSADMMQRNLNNRVEALVPVNDPNLKGRLEEVLDVELADDALAWEANPDGSWTKVVPHRGIDTHQRLLDLAAQRARGDVDLVDDALTWEANPDGSWTIVFPNLEIDDDRPIGDFPPEWAPEVDRYQP